MPWSVESDAGEGLVRIVYSDTVTKEDIAAATTAALAEAPANAPARFLAEFENAEVALSTVDLFRLPHLWDEKLADRRNRLAVVPSGSSFTWDDMKFFEATCLNRGRQVRVFAEREDAIAWLAASVPAD